MCFLKLNKNSLISILNQISLSHSCFLKHDLTDSKVALFGNIIFYNNKICLISYDMYKLYKGVIYFGISKRLRNLFFSPLLCMFLWDPLYITFITTTMFISFTCSISDPCFEIMLFNTKSNKTTFTQLYFAVYNVSSEPGFYPTAYMQARTNYDKT